MFILHCFFVFVCLIFSSRNTTIVHVRITSESFLYNQVRAMMAILVAVGQCTHPPSIVPEVLSYRSRELNRFTRAPACGLYLEKIEYKKTWKQLEIESTYQTAEQMREQFKLSLLQNEEGIEFES
jgi:tRNA U38,U39,U40 pseudouridine synthase TruA